MFRLEKFEYNILQSLGGLSAGAGGVALLFSLFALLCHAIMLFQVFGLCLQMRQMRTKIDEVFFFYLIT